jgi:hypothetical protein
LILRHVDIHVAVYVASHVAVIHLALICHIYIPGGMWFQIYRLDRRCTYRLQHTWQYMWQYYN